MMKKKVLAVDDSATIRQQVRAALEPAGFDVVEAADGLEGLARAAEHQVSMMLVDVNMPKLNGLDMLDRLRSDPMYAQVPVLMLTTEVDHALIDRAKRAGARGWMIKPVKPEHLVGAVSKLTR